MSETPAAEPGQDIRPIVARKTGRASVWIFGGAMLIAAGGLFSALEARRTEISSPTTAAPVGAAAGMIARPPELVIPQDYEAARVAALPPYALAANRSPDLARTMTAPEPPSQVTLHTSGRASTIPESSSAIQQPYAGPPAVAYQASSSLPRASDATDKSDGDARTYASRLVSPSTTVPQGTVIQAVLETALNSNHPGFARAIVSRDVTSFDGSRVLIPKGSKLFGEYKADVNLGQNRALIQWRRLTRPDGVIIDLKSPTADPLGRAGVRGKVDTHFFQRFGGAILQSVLDIGVQVAARQASGDTVIFGIPYGMQGATGIKPEDIKPTLKVRQGTSVSVFVARDLDFTEVEP